MSAAGESQAVAEAMTDAVLRGDIDTALSLISPDAVDHSALPGAPAGHGGWVAKWTHLARDSQGLTTTVDQRISDGDTVATRYSIKRSDTGDSVGFALEMIRVGEGKIVEHWAMPLPEQDAG